MPDEITNAPPQLTPIQQRFLQSLSGAPQNAVPFSAGAGLQGFSAPGFATGYQPAQSFDDPAYQKSLYEWEQEVRRKAEAARAEQAISAGIRYIYQQRYDADLKRGIPEPTAFSRMMLGISLHTPKSDPIKTFQAFQQPFTPSVTNFPGMPPAVRSGRYGERIQFPPTVPGTGPIQTEELIGGAGAALPGYRGVRGARGGVQVIREAGPLGSDLSILKQQIDEIEKDLEALPSERSERYTPAIGQERERLKALLKERRAVRDAMGPSPPTSTVATVAPIPLPRTKAELKKDVIYQTVRGPARWDGENFIKE